MGRRGEGILLNYKMNVCLFIGEGLVSVTILQTMLVVVWSTTLCICKLVSFSVKYYWSVCECWPVGWIPEIMSGVRG